MYKILKILPLILAFNIALGQGEKNFAYYNNETYKLYSEARWQELIPLAKESIQNGFDFYYMRMRLGIAYFEQGHYSPAKKQFEKALKFDPESPDPQSYLYYCNQYLGRQQEAMTYYDINHEKSKFIQSIYFEPGFKFTDNTTQTRDLRYVFIGLNHEFGHRFTLFHGYQRLSADFVSYLPMPPGPGPGGPVVEYPYSIIQNEYYAAPSILIAKGFYMSPAYHFQSVSGEGFMGSNRVFSFQLAKWLGRFKLYSSYYYSEINKLQQHQIEGGVVYYPLGNTNFYLQSQVTCHSENSVRNTIYFNKMGFKVFSRTWIDGFLTYGDMTNFSEQNGYVVYNQLDKITSKWGVSINQYLGKHLLYLGYIHENKEEYLTEIPFVHRNVILGFNLTF